MELFRLRRIGNRRAAIDDGIGGLHEEEGRLAIGVLAHLARMGRIIAPDAENAPDREAVGAPGDRDGSLRRGRQDVAHLSSPKA